ncbi:hypothetical protein DFA_04416 [Cavenderia fasciculata]|uniref:Ankyrin repeat-containing protein n=1 Tax=Cavenderia fasciculata TaxID=261658 RepID=F4PPI5_CACFS|nr:uncharacterized protein DFA_04416 [Cavenderia fasciculata]EGG22298.1 hypothetical protein DFA_04416 [Cavenderia fasciculata]|eukprot:XP_004360149.1 hypothetical protein DFA_04416 [Cavenderia fasciculata]
MVTTTTFHCIFRSIYIRHLIFNQIGVISNRLYSKVNEQGYKSSSRSNEQQRQLRSLKGKDIIKLPRLKMISKFGLPWHFLSHYLPKDRVDLLVLERAISKYCCHRNATLDTLERLLEWSTLVDFNWNILQRYMKGLERNQEILEYLIKRCPASGYNNFLFHFLEFACNNGNLSIVKSIKSIKDVVGLDSTSIIMYTACIKGFIDIVKYLHENHKSIGCDRDAMFLHFNRTEGCTRNALNKAAEYGHLDIVRFLHEHRTEGCSKVAMNEASRKGFIDIVKFLHQHRTEGATTMAMDWAARNGYIEIVKFLHFNRTEGATTDALDWAAAWGHFEIVKFLSEHRTEGATNDAIDEASINGYTEIVEYLSLKK